MADADIRLPCRGRRQVPVHPAGFRQVERHRLAFSWDGGFPSTVEFALQEVEGGRTRVRFEMAGFDAAGEFGDGARKGADYFWGKKALSNTLPAVLDRLAAGR
jgi:hypothetical protein